MNCFSGILSQEISLRGEGFLPVEENGACCYGGDQRWWAHCAPKKEKNGCSAVAAANTLAYLAQSRPFLRALYPYPDLNQGFFLSYMEELYRAVLPPIYGKVSLRDYVKDVTSFCLKRGVRIHAQLLYSRRGEEACLSFLRQALEADLPVSAVNLSLRPGFDYRWHWVTVTGLAPSPTGVQMTISSLGRRETVDFSLFHSCMRRTLLPSGYAVFSPEQQKELP